MGTPPTEVKKSGLRVPDTAFHTAADSATKNRRARLAGPGAVTAGNDLCQDATDVAAM